MKKDFCKKCGKKSLIFYKKNGMCSICYDNTRTKNNIKDIILLAVKELILEKIRIYKYRKYNIPELSGTGKNYGGRDRLREIVRIRDNHTCKICGKVWIVGARRLDVHHLNKEAEGNVGRKYRENLDWKNMITLCHRCHLGIVSKNKFFTDFNLSTNSQIIKS